MKIKEGFELRQVGDDHVIITIGDAVSSFNGMIKINESGAFIWEELKKGTDLQNVISLVASKYSIDNETAVKDVNEFIDTLKQTNCFTELNN